MFSELSKLLKSQHKGYQGLKINGSCKDSKCSVKTGGVFSVWVGRKIWMLESTLGNQHQVSLFMELNYFGLRSLSLMEKGEQLACGRFASVRATI